ncbi:Monovalent cation:proton antiporter 2 [Pleurotus pulmonarius]
MSPSFSSLLMTLQRRSAAEQGGVISGDNPTKYSENDPFRLWSIQIVIIIITSRLCHLVLARTKQPRVVAEIMGGIVLGPTLLGRIDGFSETIFPAPSIPLLQLCATLGLVFFLFLAALEIDVQAVKSSARASSAISVAGILVPAAFGAILAVILYPQFSDPTVNFAHFTLFTIVSVSITAFPILCRMLEELKLYDTQLGVVVISAGVGNDIVGWVLLALAVTLTNSSSRLTPLWIVLTCVGFTIYNLFPVRWLYWWAARKTGGLEHGEPSAMMMSLAIFILIINAFFTDVIGLHAIFGAFLTGLIIPRENGYARNMFMKLDDIVSTIFLPIYFTLSGLKTDLGLLNNGKAWGFTVVVCILAFSGKFLGCSGAARLSGFQLRESFAIGTLMTCKGLLELIVINLGLQAGILTNRLFAMFVVHAMVLTFIITPLTAIVLPEKGRDAIPRLSSSGIISEDERSNDGTETRGEEDVKV